MNRSEVFKSIVPVITDELVICNIGLPSQELHMVDDQPTNFEVLPGKVHGGSAVLHVWGTPRRRAARMTHAMMSRVGRVGVASRPQ